MPSKILTANRLHDGLTVFLGEDGAWSRDVSHSRVAANEKDCHDLLALGQAAETAREIVGPYLIEVEIRAGCPQPTRYRERLRASGPSVETQSSTPAAEKERSHVSL